MVPQGFHIRSLRAVPASSRLPAGAGLCPGLAGKAGRIAALSGLLAAGLPMTSSAQAPGTMQVTARVVPASAAWAGVTEAEEAARGAIRDQSGQALSHRRGLVQARSEILGVGDERFLLVTIHYPLN